MECQTILMKFLLFLYSWKSIYKVSSNGIHSLFSGIRLLLLYLGHAMNLDKLIAFAEALKTSLPSIRNYAGIKRDDFQIKICCPKCDSVYTYEEGFYINSRGRKIPNTCTYKAFPNHKQEKFRKPCGALLMKKIGTTDGKEFLHPKRVYCYRSLKKSIIDISCSYKSFYNVCNSWKTRETADEILKDIYDGALWTDYFKGNFSISYIK